MKQDAYPPEIRDEEDTRLPTREKEHTRQNENAMVLTALHLQRPKFPLLSVREIHTRQNLDKISYPPSSFRRPIFPPLSFGEMDTRQKPMARYTSPPPHHPAHSVHWKPISNPNTHTHTDTVVEVEPTQFQKESNPVMLNKFSRTKIQEYFSLHIPLP